MDGKSFNKAVLGPGWRFVADSWKWVVALLVIQVEGFVVNLAIARAHSPLSLLFFPPAR